MKKKRVIELIENMVHRGKMPEEIKEQLTKLDIDISEDKFSKLFLKAQENARKNKVDREHFKRDVKFGELELKNKELQERNKLIVAELQITQAELHAALSLEESLSKPLPGIVAKHGDGKNEGTVIITASDWHLEEEVISEAVNGKNSHNLEISKKRNASFFVNALRIINVLNKDISIKKVIIALLGDFITGNIHEENLESCLLRPADAIVEAELRIATGIDFLLNNSKYDFDIICHVGNHSRITKKQRHSTEKGNSLETVMYAFLARRYAGNKRVRFHISPGYLSYHDVYDKRVRFHHGHNIKFQGGIGGLFIPAFKAISQWNKLDNVNLDIFGHFHQSRDGGNFISNGSSIGWSAYAIGIKGEFEVPRQTLFLIDKKRGKTITTPIILD